MLASGPYSAMMNPVTVAKTLLDLRKHLSLHPLTRNSVSRSMLRFVRYQLAWRATGAPTLVDWVGGTRLIVGAGMRGVTGEVYLGVNEFEDVLLVAHLLRPGDLFVDVGANVGSYTLIAAKVGGANTVTIEPIPATVEQLIDHLRLNRIEERVEIVSCGVSAEPGELWFTSGEDALNRVTATPDARSMRVPVRTLDDVLSGKAPLCLKIDVEEHESAVVAGAQLVLANPALKVVLIETGVANRNEAFLKSFTDHGFAPHRYDPATRELKLTGTIAGHNTLFVRDPAFVQARLRDAAKVKVGEQMI